MAEPQAQIKGAPPGHNGLLRVGGYGRRYVRVASLNFGLRIIATVNEESVSRRAFYPIVTTGSSFRMQIIHPTLRDRNRFNAWMRTYLERIAANDTDINGYMSIQVPVRRFYRVAVPAGPGGSLEYGDDWGQHIFATALDFIGASDPINRNLTPKQAGLSYFRNAKDMPDARYFYPAGQQKKGLPFELEESIFNPFIREQMVSVEDPLEGVPEGPFGTGGGPGDQGNDTEPSAPEDDDVVFDPDDFVPPWGQ